MVNRGAKYASWGHGDPDGLRVNDNVKVIHMWLASHRKVVNAQVFLYRTAEGLVESLPCEEIASASFRESDDKWHSANLQVQAWLCLTINFQRVVNSKIKFGLPIMFLGRRFTKR